MRTGGVAAASGAQLRRRCVARGTHRPVRQEAADSSPEDFGKTAIRPLYQPQFGQTRCGSLGWWQWLHSISRGVLIARWLRRSPWRACGHLSLRDTHGAWRSSVSRSRRDGRTGRPGRTRGRSMRSGPSAAGRRAGRGPRRESSRFRCSRRPRRPAGPRDAGRSAPRGRRVRARTGRPHRPRTGPGSPGGRRVRSARPAGWRRG